MKKTFVLDTNVLLFDPRSIFNFQDNDVVIPIYVIEEIDRFKKEPSELGRNARQVSRYLDQLRVEGSLAKGVRLDKGGLLKVSLSSKPLPEFIATDNIKDSKILAVVLDIQSKIKENEKVIFISNDSNLRIRCDAVGIESENFESEDTIIDDLDRGYTQIEVSSQEIDKFYSEKKLQLPDSYYAPNEYAILKSTDNSSHTAIGQIKVPDGHVVPIASQKQGVWGIKPRNKEQIFALDLLLDDSIQFVTLVGKAGTGKTLIALAAGLQKVTEDSHYDKLLVSRPIFPLGKDIGYLPGDVEEKLNPWMQPIFDNVEFLMGLSRKKSEDKRSRSYRELIDMGFLQIEPLTYIRGRSIPHQFMIVDEAQNLTPHEVKTIVSRAGEGTKIVLTGDIYQIDNPYIDSTNNGLIHAVNKFKGETISGHTMLVKGERSSLAEIATNIL